MPSKEFRKLVKQSSTIADILRHFGFAVTGRAHRMVKARIEKENIDASHISLGLDNCRGKRFQREKTPLSLILVAGSTYARGHLKRRLLDEGLLKNECCICGQGPEWNGKSLTLILDHINGIRDDNRLENLRILCPNCDSQQSTFAGRNKSRKLSASSSG